MRHIPKVAVVALMVVLATVAFAGEKKAKKCEGDPQDCLAKMHQKYQNVGWLGIEYDTTDSGHFKIGRVVDKSPAEAAGFKAGDVVLTINGAEVSKENKTALKKMKSLGPGAQVTYLVKRSGGKQELTATLGKVPETVMAQWVGQHMINGHMPVKVASAEH